MTALRTPWSTYIDQQHRQPHGLVGRLIGERMVRQHKPETTWSIALLGLQSTDRVLEIGFGAGRGLALALQQSPHGHITGIDLSRTMIHAAAERNRVARRARRLSLVRADMIALPFQRQRFDKIVSIHTFYFWPEPLALLQQLLGLLPSGGRMVTTFATAHIRRGGERAYWSLHYQAEELLKQLHQQSALHAELCHGPDSRQFNNVALVIDQQ